jgi:hypothetical protein
MRIRKLIQQRIRRRRDGVSVSSDVNVAVAGILGERGAVTKVSARQQSTDEAGTKRGTDV